MIACCREDAKGYLAGRFSDAEETAFVAHLDNCPRCREWLEESSGGDYDWQLARELLSYTSASAESPAPPVASAIAMAGEASLVENAGIPETVNLAALSFLAPSDDPQMIGRVGPYEISGFLGRGAMGIVLKGFD